jgi:hypothetical protein
MLDSKYLCLVSIMTGMTIVSVYRNIRSYIAYVNRVAWKTS